MQHKKSYHDQKVLSRHHSYGSVLEPCKNETKTTEISLLKQKLFLLNTKNAEWPPKILNLEYDDEKKNNINGTA